MRRAALSLLAVSCWSACATSTDEGARARVLGADDGDFDPSYGREAVALMRALIRTGARGEEAGLEAVRLVEDRLDAAGISTDVRPVGTPKRVNLLARVAGTAKGARPFVLVAHADSFPADAAAWSEGAPPYDAAIVGEHVVGRGALDMHAPLALMAHALVALADRKVALPRDVLLLVVAGGESDGAGIRQALGDWPELARAEVALGEGGFLLSDWARPGQEVAAVAVGEKGRLAARVVTRGERLPVERAGGMSAPTRLAAALARLARLEGGRISDDALATSAALLEARGGAAALFARAPALARLFGDDVLARDPLGAAMLSSTCGVVQLAAGAPSPVVPPWAEAVIDCRFLAGESVAQFRDRLLVTLDDPRVELVVLDAAPPSRSPARGAVVDVIRAEVGGARPVVTFVQAAKSDLGPLRARGVAAYGFVPLVVDRNELLAIHGSDERVRTREVEAALPRLVGIVIALARL